MRCRTSLIPFFALALAVLVHCGTDDDDRPGPEQPDSGFDASLADAPAADAPAPPDANDDAALGTTMPQILATSPGKDEDPSLLRAVDGTFYVAWYSNRDGSHRCWIKSSTNGRDWSADRAITPADEAHFYPSLIQSKDGRFHLVTFRGSLSDAGKLVGTIRYTSSLDTVAWNAGVSLTDASALAWTPTITERTPGALFVTWSSDATGDKDIYLRASTNGGADWSPSTTKLTDGTFNDDIPFIVTRSDGSLLILWQRYDVAVTADDAPFTHPSNDLVYATSTDGAAWSAPIAITNDPPAAKVPDVISSLYPSTDPTGWSVAWSSARGTSGSGDISSIGLGSIPVTPANVKQLTDTPGNDYSPRLIPAGVPGLYMMAWVSDRGALVDGGPNLDIYYQLVRP